MHLTTLRSNYPRCEHAGVHADIGCQRRKGYRGHRGKILEVEDHDKGVEHVSCGGLFKRGTTRDNKVLLDVHIVYEGRVGAPLVYDVELDGVEDVNVAVGCSCAYITALFHLDVMVCGGYLNEFSQHSGRQQQGDPTLFTISPLFVSMTNIVSCTPATRISEVAFEVKLMHRRSLMSSAL